MMECGVDLNGGVVRPLPLPKLATLDPHEGELDLNMVDMLIF